MSEELERLQADLADARHNFDVEFGIATKWLDAYNARTDELIKANAERDAARAALRDIGRVFFVVEDDVGQAWIAIAGALGSQRLASIDAPTTAALRAAKEANDE